MVTATTMQPLRELVADVPDPEIPVLTIDDLGILRDVRSIADGAIEVDITPTYSGCPAMDAIRDDITRRLTDAGYERVRVRLVLAPAWTTDWISDDGRRKLSEFGIAPPPGTAPHRSGPVSLTLSVRCPRCGSPDTRELSRFGSTACKALWRCNQCSEPFDHFKAL
ncbi:MAG TPA: 1,2-phenylacetyl-CoA epoxidase subunit PaaD [Nocardioidaceae bacterium]|nr:1,2-phenylacetyl-CoA epoxidase subunit PaaD [Nocardioidaceae bacterium]